MGCPPADRLRNSPSCRGDRGAGLRMVHRPGRAGASAARRRAAIVVRRLGARDQPEAGWRTGFAERRQVTGVPSLTSSRIAPRPVRAPRPARSARRRVRSRAASARATSSALHLPSPDQLKRADHVAHLVMEERARRGARRGSPRRPATRRAHRASSPAISPGTGGAEGGEIVLPDQVPRRLRASPRHRAAARPARRGRGRAPAAPAGSGCGTDSAARSPTAARGNPARPARRRAR